MPLHPHSSILYIYFLFFVFGRKLLFEVLDTERKGLFHHLLLSFLIPLQLVRKFSANSPSFDQLFVVLFSERVDFKILPLAGLCCGTVTELVVVEHFTTSIGIRLFKGNLDHFLVIEVVLDEGKEGLMSAHQGWLLHVVDDTYHTC